MLPLKAIFIAPEFENEEKTRVARLLNTLLWAILGALSVLLTIRLWAWITHPQPDSTPPMILASITLVMVVSLWLLRQGAVSLSGGLVTSILYLGTFYGAALANNGLRSANTSIFVLIVLLAALLLGRRGAVSFTVLSLIALGWFYRFDQPALAIHTDPLPFDRILIPALVLIVTAVALDLTVRSVSDSLTRARRDEHELAAANEELKRFNTALEERVIERTRKLALVTNIGEKLSDLVTLADYLDDMVESVRENFGYYYVQLLIRDETSDELVVRAGTGAAGAELKTHRFGISLSLSTSPVARAARHGEVIHFNDLRTLPGWLPNPLLPQSVGELVMPLVVQDQVVGVLDIHTARLGGVAEEDVSLLRSLANNLAGVIRRGRLFTELDTALTETRAAQARYLAQTWQKKKLDTESRQQLYLRSGTGLDDAGQARLNRVKKVALQLTAPALMPPIKSDSDQTVADGQPVRPSIVAPVILHDHAIGHLQLHPTTDGRPWSKEDLAMIEVVVSQLAQAAENLRLFDEAQNRAMFERRAAEISSRLRQAPTLESLARTAVEEISTTLEASHGLVKIGLSEVGRWSSPD